jgi:hypothetical protein
MDAERKGQVQAITVVLLTGITIGVASIVYVWGQPILNKRESQAQLDSVERKVLDLRQEIIRVSEAGEGAASEVQMNLEDTDYEIRIIKLNQSSDFIDVIVEADSTPYPNGKWTMLKGDNMQNISIASGDYALKGEDKGSVLMVKPQSSIVRYRIEFRNLYSQDSTGSPLEKTDIQSSGGSVSSGEAEVYIRNAGTIVDTGREGLEISSGQTLNRKRTVVNVDLR